MSEALDFAHDSFAEITLKQAEALQEQQETIEQQGYRILFLLSENLALKDDADSVIAHEHERLVEALLVVEGWTFRQLKSGEEWMSARAMYRLLQEIYDYAENNVVPPWLEIARRTLLDAMEDEEELEGGRP